MQGGEDEFEQALREIHRLASAYEGPLTREFMQLALLSAPVEPGEPVGEVPEGDSPDNAAPARRVARERFTEALSLLMVLAFPVNSGTERAVRRELNELLGSEQTITSMHMRVGNRKRSLKSNLGRLPTKRQIQLREILLGYLPVETQEDL